MAEHEKKAEKAFKIRVTSVSQHNDFRIPDPVNWHQFYNQQTVGAGPDGRQLGPDVHPKPKVLLNQALTLGTPGDSIEVTVDKSLLDHLKAIKQVRIHVLGETSMEEAFPADAPIQTHEDKIKAQRGDDELHPMPAAYGTAQGQGTPRPAPTAEEQSPSAHKGHSAPHNTPEAEEAESVRAGKKGGR